MKGSVLASTLVPAALLASACAATRPPAMPEWSAPEVSSLVAGAPLDIDDERMRVPREDEAKEELWPAQGLYIGGEILTTQPLGDFDDGGGLQAPAGDVVIVPELDVGAGVGAYVSYRWRMNELVLQGSVSEHDGESSLVAGDFDTKLYNLDLNWRHYFWEESPLQPYGLLGVGMSWADIEDGALDPGGSVPPEDAELDEGININVGAGAALYTLPWVTFYGQALYRFTVYKTADGISPEMSIVGGDVDGDSFTLSAGAALRLFPPRR
jgi:hypothetical protein